MKCVLPRMPKPVWMKSAKTNHRDAQVTIVMGRNGTGKSTLVKTIVDALGGRILVVTMNGMPEIWRPYPVIDASKAKAWEWKSGIRQVHYLQHEKETFRHIHRHFRDGILILDDCRNYITSNLDNNEYLKHLLIDFRHKMMDVYFIVHSPGQVPKQVWTFYSNAIILATDALFAKNSVNIDSGERIVAAQKEVNQEYSAAREKGDGSHYGIFRLIEP